MYVCMYVCMYSRSYDIIQDAPYGRAQNLDNPGPGTYGEKRLAFSNVRRKVVLEDPIGFGSVAIRPCNQQKLDEDTVGPGRAFTCS